MNLETFSSRLSNKFNGFVQWLRCNPWFSVFVVMLILKIWLLSLGREQLVQEHWRILSERASVSRHIYFSIFMGLSILIPVWLRPKITLPSSGKGMLAVFLVVMSFLMPELLWRNYIHTIMEGPLSIWDMRHYLIADLFFQGPYLILHLIGLGVAWFVGKRMNDDRIYLSGFAASLSILCGSLLSIYNLRLYRADLWMMSILFVLGVIQLVFKLSLGRRNYFALYAVALSLLAVGLYLDHLRWISMSFQLSYLLLSIAFSWILGRLVFQDRPSCSLFNLLWVYIFFVSINLGYPLCANMGNVFRLGLLLGRYVMDDLIIILLVFLATRRFGRGGLITFSMISLVYLAASYVDVNYFVETGRRLSGFMLEMGGGTGMAVKMVSQYLTFSFFVAFITIFSVALAGPILAYRDCSMMDEAKGSVRRWLSTAVLIAVLGALWCKPDSFVASFPRNVISDSAWLKNLRSPMVEKEALLAGFEQAGAPLTFPEQVTMVASAERNNLVLVILESMPNIHLSLFGGQDETQPMMRNYVDRMERYPNIFCSWPTSNHARTSIWSGLYPIRPFLSVLNPMIGRSSLTEILKDAGYYNAFFYSSDRNYTRLNDYLGHRGLDLIEDAKTMGQDLPEEQYVSWGVREDVTLGAMTNFLAERAVIDEPFSMMYIPACPHMPYDTHDERFNTFKEGGNALDGNYTGAYKNQLLYMDWILTSLMEELERTGLLDNTVVVLVNDHGEQVSSKNGGLGHGWSCEPAIANIPMMVFEPGTTEAKINYTPGSQIDVLPTILDYLNIPLPAGMSQQGRSLLDEFAGNRRIYLGSYRDYAVIEDGTYYWLPNGDLPSAVYFKMSNDVARSYFQRQIDPLPAEVWSELEDGYGTFREMQESLIRHYDSYKW